MYGGETGLGRGRLIYGYSVEWAKMIHEKISWVCPFKSVAYKYTISILFNRGLVNIFSLRASAVSRLDEKPK
jgi:hypothetical protein